MAICIIKTSLTVKYSDKRQGVWLKDSLKQYIFHKYKVQLFVLGVVLYYTPTYNSHTSIHYSKISDFSILLVLWFEWNWWHRPYLHIFAANQWMIYYIYLMAWLFLSYPTIHLQKIQSLIILTRQLMPGQFIEREW